MIQDSPSIRPMITVGSITWFPLDIASPRKTDKAYIVTRHITQKNGIAKVVTMATCYGSYWCIPYGNTGEREISDIVAWAELPKPCDF